MRKLLKSTPKLLLIFLFIGLNSCSGRVNTETNSETETTTAVLKSSYDFLNQIDVLEIPTTIDTSFDNFQQTEFLTPAQVELLNLKVLNEEPATQFALGAKIVLSDSLKTYLIHYLPNEHELFSALVNYDDDFTMLDFHVVAYDDIAEGFARVYSDVYHQLIKTTSVTFFNEEPETVINELKLTSDGKFMPQ